MSEQLKLDLCAPSVPPEFDRRGKSIGDYIHGIYSRSTEADFAHMERMLREHEGQPSTSGSNLAELLLTLRAMEMAEREVFAKLHAERNSEGARQ